MAEKHTLRVFDQDLESLSTEILNLAACIGLELDGALEALTTGDPAKVQAVIDSNRKANHLQDRINQHIARVLARQQAVADDLRAILAAARIAPHLERIGDYAKNTVRRTRNLSRPVDPDVSAQFCWMVTRIQSMLHRVTEAYARRDAEAANVAWANDAEVDAVYAGLFQHVLQQMREDSSRVADGTHLLFIAKGLERAGDHVTDIAEEVYFMVTGKPLRGPRPKVNEQGQREA